MEVEHYTNTTHYHQTVQTVETVEIIDLDHSPEENDDNQESAMEGGLYLHDNHPADPQDQDETTQKTKDTTWLRRVDDTLKKPMDMQRNITNPYKPRSGRHQNRIDRSTAPTHLTTLNARRISSGATLEPLSSTRSDKASLGRED